MLSQSEAMQAGDAGASSARIDEAEAARQGAVRALASADWARAEVFLDAAEAGFALDDDAALDEATRDRAEEGRALCAIHRADLAIRAWKLGEAERQLDTAYKVLKQRPAEAELWRVTARIAERRGRLGSARAAWKKVVRIARGRHEGVTLDAHLRLAELALNEGRTQPMREALEAAADLVGDDAVARARVRLLEADALAVDGELDASLEAHRDLERDHGDLPQDFVALAQLRRAGVEVHRDPSQAVQRVLRAGQRLDRLRHPDALGVAYGQLSVIALALRRPLIAAVAAVGANASRSGDTVALGLLTEALADLPEASALRDLDQLELPQLQQALVGTLAKPAHGLGVAWTELGTMKGLEKLAAPLAQLGATGVRVDVEAGEVIRSTRLVGHRGSLAWDAPLGVLRTVVVSAPLVVPRRPAMWSPATDPQPTQGIPATPPPPPPRRRRRGRRAELRLVLIASLVALTSFAGVSGLAVWGLLLAKATDAVQAQAAPTAPPAVTPAPTPPAPTEPPLDIVALPPLGPEIVEIRLSSQGVKGRMQVRGQGVDLWWSGAEAQLALPPGEYVLQIEGSQHAEPFVVKAGAICTVRWLPGVVLPNCSSQP